MSSHLSDTGLGELHWLTERPVPLDYHGPVNVPFEPMGEEWHQRTPVERFDHMVERYPDRLAVDDGTTQLTYAQLQVVARALARDIDAVAPAGRPIALVFRYTALFPAAVMAGLASGRPIIPVDIGHPIERQRMILDNAGAGSVLKQRGIAHEIELPDVPLIEADLDELRGAELGDWPAVTLDMDAVAGVTYTSGSTGRPKGLAWSMTGLMPTVAGNNRAQHFRPDDKIITLASLAATGLGDVMSALMNGAALRVVEIASAGLGEMMRIMGEERVTMLSFVPSILRNVLQMEGVAHSLRHLRVLDLHGDVTLAADVEFFRTKLSPDCHIRVLLGSMDAGALFHWFVPRDFVAEGLALPCGYLADSKSIALLDEAGRPVPAGEPGEILVRGRTMALGLWQEGRLMPGPFRPDPEDPRSRLYPMGDLVRLRADGLAEFIGRRDRQVKVRGQRADLGDIEAALRQDRDVADVAVIAQTDEGDATIIAFLVATDRERPPELASLRSRVAAETAPHMVPARWHFLPEIPRLPNYKADLVRLAAMAPTLVEPDAETPRRPAKAVTADPATLAAVERAWRATLGAQADPRRSWAAAGGDSLKALHLLFRIEELLGERVPFDVLDDDANAHDLAVAIGQLGAASDDAADERPAVLFLPGIGGDEPVLASFRRELSPFARIVTVHYPGPEAPVAAIGSIQSIGDAAIAQAEGVTGPLHVVGYSFGGIIALDVARRLREAGREIGVCAALDTEVGIAAGPAGPQPGKARQILGGLYAAGQTGQLYDHFIQIGSRMLLRIGAAEVLRRLTTGTRGVAPRAALNMQQVLVLALRGRAFTGWTPGVYPGRFWLFRSDDADAGMEPSWRSVAPDLRVVPVAGSHRSMVSGEHGRALAAALRAAIEEEQRRRSTPA